jgi:hypothetical protein
MAGQAAGIEDDVDGDVVGGAGALRRAHFDWLSVTVKS